MRESRPDCGLPSDRHSGIISSNHCVTIPMQVIEVKVQVPIEVSEADARYLLAIKLFETGRLSLGQAAELSGYSYRAFLEVLRQNKISIVNYPASDLRREIAR